MFAVKVLFLDIDGVLNSSKWFTCGGVAKDLPMRYPDDHFDPTAVALLNEITDRTGASIVVSSSWRYGRSVVELADLLGSVGVSAHVIDKTPMRFSQHCEGRGREIKAWLLVNEDAGVESFCILDDYSDMEPLMEFLVKTTSDVGLQREHVERAVSLLGCRHMTGGDQ